MKAKSLCIATATYRPICGCPVTRYVVHGSEVPRCPECGRAVDWLLLLVPLAVATHRDHSIGA